MGKNRSFTITMNIEDNEGPEDTEEEFCKTIKEYLIDTFTDLAFDIKDIQVSSSGR